MCTYAVRMRNTNNNTPFIGQAPMFELFLKYEVKSIWYDILPFDYHVEHLQQCRRELKAGEGRRLTLPQDCALEYAGAVDYYLRHKHLYR